MTISEKPLKNIWLLLSSLGHSGVSFLFFVVISSLVFVPLRFSLNPSCSADIPCCTCDFHNFEIWFPIIIPLSSIISPNDLSSPYIFLLSIPTWAKCPAPLYTLLVLEIFIQESENSLCHILIWTNGVALWNEQSRKLILFASSLDLGISQFLPLEQTTDGIE